MDGLQFITRFDLLGKARKLNLELFPKEKDI